MKLTPRQQRFVDEYLIDLNGTQAVIRAGYSVNGADVQAVQLLGNPRVKAAVDRAIANRVNRIQVKQDDVVRELWRIAMVDPAKAFDTNGALLPIHEMPEEVRRAISTIEEEEIFERSRDSGGRGKRRRVGLRVKVKFWSKTDALEKLARHIGMLQDSPATNLGVAVQVVLAEDGQGDEVCDNQLGRSVPIPASSGAAPLEASSPSVTTLHDTPSHDITAAGELDAPVEPETIDAHYADNATPAPLPRDEPTASLQQLPERNVPAHQQKPDGMLGVASHRRPLAARWVQPGTSRMGVDPRVFEQLRRKRFGS